jgi:hypothetical protein
MRSAAHELGRICPLTLRSRRYRDLLNGWKLWTVRAKLDIERSAILRSGGALLSTGDVTSSTSRKVPKTMAEELVKVPKRTYLP